MTHSSTKTHRIATGRVLHTVVFTIVIISFTLNRANVRAARVMPSDYRLAAAADKFADARDFVGTLKVQPRRRLRAKRVELVIDTLSTSQESRLFVPLGPTQQPPVVHEQNAVAGFTNRLLARLARIVLQAFPGSLPANIKTESVSLSSINPGMKMIGRNIFIDFSNRPVHRTGETS